MPKSHRHDLRSGNRRLWAGNRHENRNRRLDNNTGAAHYGRDADLRPIAAIVNTHGHLDHSSGNGRIKATYPKAPVSTTNAVDRALADGGFLERNLESTRPMLDDPQLTDGAVTDADVWLYDEVSDVAVLGDLVTLPAPFFETACPAQWRVALDAVWAVPLKVAIPGHGAPLSRARFNAYRSAFNGFMDYVDGESTSSQCAAAWADGVSSLIGDDERMRKMSLEYAEYYVGMLRRNGGRSADCLER